MRRVLNTSKVMVSPRAAAVYSPALDKLIQNTAAHRRAPDAGGGGHWPAGRPAAAAESNASPPCGDAVGEARTVNPC